MTPVDHRVRGNRRPVNLLPVISVSMILSIPFAAGNGLNKVSPFNLSPWGADLEDDLRDINRRGRDFLLNAWYRHELDLGAEIGFAVRSSLGAGHYRFVFSQTSKDFVDPGGESPERRHACAISFDQELGLDFGAFLRVDQQSDRAAIDYDSAYSAGLHIRGGLWGREMDNIGLGIGLLNGGNQEIERTRVAEVYYRFVNRAGFALTADLQYMEDDKTVGRGPRGTIIGLRVDLNF